MSWAMGPANKINASHVRAYFHNCFSCFFGDLATTGVPKKMPSEGTVVPLRVGVVGTFTVRKGKEWYFPTRNNFGWVFIAEPGHLDGAGSTISFDYYDRVDGQFVQTVSAFIKNDFWAGNEVYKFGAANTWNYMANRLGQMIIALQGSLPFPR
ncbi:hypothetical protein [Lysinibacter sp. HNR]|uniref:hypothetical protein n=1 Tax=Lysinibacter sp. HNR TaxID=3031408 RepID=UPI002435DED3|nr:hypothetical protein [Lysinibacter sp. HNR]WGD37755.1 hypothetical protein FrondiHNR_02245 [Lysinibacter sp. HNR]